MPDLLNPINNRTFLWIATQLSKHSPSFFWQRFKKNAKALGLDRLYVILSFDCDTPEDISASELLYHRFQKENLKFSLSVPGEELREGKEVYRSLAKRGVPFLNHGFKSHAERRGDRYFSTTFYHEMTALEIEEDVRQGHMAVYDVTGTSPLGFRTPHFGLFQKTWQIQFVHKLLHKMGYKYSSSTGPIYAFLFGSAWEKNDVLEIPLSGSYTSPLSVLDSWNFVRDPRDPISDDQYSTLLSDTLGHLFRSRSTGILNYYCDPSHIYQSEAYDRVIFSLVKNDIPTLYFEELLTMLGRI